MSIEERLIITGAYFFLCSSLRVNPALDPSQNVRVGDALLQMNRGIKKLRLLIGLETHHGRLSMNRGVANPINTSAHTCNGYLGNSPLYFSISLSACTTILLMDA
jgi:hypothetical protein